MCLNIAKSVSSGYLKPALYQQWRSQKFVFGGIKLFWGGIKLATTGSLLNLQVAGGQTYRPRTAAGLIDFNGVIAPCSIAILTSFLPHKKSTGTDFGGIYTHITPVAMLLHTSQH